MTLIAIQTFDPPSSLVYTRRFDHEGLSSTRILFGTVAAR